MRLLRTLLCCTSRRPLVAFYDMHDALHGSMVSWCVLQRERERGRVGIRYQCPTQCLSLSPTSTSHALADRSSPLREIDNIHGWQSCGIYVYLSCGRLRRCPSLPTRSCASPASPSLPPSAQWPDHSPSPAAADRHSRLKDVYSSRIKQNKSHITARCGC